LQDDRVRATTKCDYDRVVSDRPVEQQRTRRDTARTVAVVVLAALLAVFAVLNRDDVQVDWILGSGRAPLIIVIGLSVVFGVLLTWLGERIAARRRGPGSRH
jgi:uncharacterized integral membrane protein